MKNWHKWDNTQGKYICPITKANTDFVWTIKGHQVCNHCSNDQNMTINKLVNKAYRSWENPK